MTTPDDLNDGAARLYAATSPLSPQDEQESWPLATFCAGLGKILEELEAVTEPQPDGRCGLDNLFDPDVARRWTLPWLAMATGTKLPEQLPEVAARETIKQAPGQDRGTAPGIIGVARRHSSNPATAAVTFSAPYNDSLHEALLAVIQFDDPSYEALKRELPQVQPAWLSITTRNDPGWSVAMVESAYAGRTIGALETDYAGSTVDDFEHYIPSA